ncbi:MAG: prolyl oligopeptidase family serine peptidase [Planctomyces sp.]|nr:prolyl oligopeptidase family serine peptidase [Planctomyces sp.]
MLRFMLAAAVCLLVSLAVAVLRAEDLAARFEKKEFAGSVGELLYRWHAPPDLEAGRKYPLVIFLHGAGERGDDNAAQLIHGVKVFASDEVAAKNACFVAAPQCPRGQTWASIDRTRETPRLGDQASAPAALVLELIDSLSKEFPIDADRIYITGLSMGGYGTFDLLMREPQRFAAAVPVCGGADVSRAESIKDIPIWIYHGAKDTAVPVERSREIVEALKAAGGAPRYTEYPDIGHDSWNGAYIDQEMLTWLFEQRLSQRTAK